LIGYLFANAKKGRRYREGMMKIIKANLEEETRLNNVKGKLIELEKKLHSKKEFKD